MRSDLTSPRDGVQAGGRCDASWWVLPSGPCWTLALGHCWPLPSLALVGPLPRLTAGPFEAFPRRKQSYLVNVKLKSNDDDCVGKPWPTSKCWQNRIVKNKTICRQTDTYIYIYMYIYTYTHMYICIYIHKYIYMYMNAYIHVYTYIYMYV